MSTRGRGRPKGSKNKSTNGKKWGRPKGSKNKRKTCMAFINYNERCSCECLKTESYCERHYNQFYNYIPNHLKKIENEEEEIMSPSDDESYEYWQIEADYKIFNLNNQLWKFYPKYEKWIKYKNNYNEIKDKYINKDIDNLNELTLR